MARRSKRLENTPAKPLADEGNEEMREDVLEESDGDCPKTKKRKVTQSRAGEAKFQGRKGKGKRGLLKDVVDMPMDILFVIFGYLEPLDLLNLSRTSKDLRAILMNRTSISLWKRVFNNVSIPGLPECPEDLSEPQYAELAFNKSCTFCGRKLTIIHIAWEMRVKTCNSCLKEHFRETVYSYLYDDIDDLIPTIEVTPNGFGRKSKSYTLRNTSALLLVEYQSLDSAEAKEAWFERKREEQEVIRSHARAYADWAEIQQTELNMQKANVIEERKEIVFDHLREMGWGAELDFMPGAGGPGDDPTILKFCQKEITSRGLHGMEEYFNKFMADLKSRRLIHEQNKNLQAKLFSLKEIYSDYLKTLPSDAHYPTTADVFQEARVQEIMYDATNPTLSPEQLDELRQLFPDIVKSWPDSLKQRIMESVLEDPSVNSVVFDPINVWNSVSTVFHCDKCSANFFPKDAIRHRCSDSNHYGFSGEDGLFRFIAEYPWNGRWRVSSITEKVAKILEICSFDPATTTIEHFEKVDPIFECLSCHDIERGRCMLRWSGLHRHCSAAHWRSDVFKVIVVDEETAPKIRERMDEDYERNAIRSQSFMCTHCRWAGRFASALDHVKLQHQVSKPIPGKDVIVNPLSIPWQDSYYSWPPRLREDVAEMMEKMQ